MNSYAETTSAQPPVNVLLLTNRLETTPAGGRELLCKLNRDALREIYGERFTVFELVQKSVRGIASIFGAFRGHIDGLTSETITRVLQEIRKNKVTKVFVDGSNFGELVKAAKKQFPEIQIYTFFHNVEVRFFLGALRQYKTPRALAVLLVNYLAESKSVKFSDKIICLTERDSLLLHRIYGRAATHISPMALHDKLPASGAVSNDNQHEKFALFVGGVFYANRAGIAWFVKNVVPRIGIKTCIVGKGFEGLKEELQLEGKVEVVGEVESLADWYLKSYFVVAPIFDGSGMKTKVAEALMFGKNIIGTSEAFSGYEEIADRAGRVCASADDFVAAIEAADTIVKRPFDSELRAAYEAKYSYAAARTRLARILSDENS